MSETKQEFFDKLNAEQKAVSIPYYLHEGEMFRLERLNKRWFIAFLIVLVMLFVTNGAWIVHEMQYKGEKGRKVVFFKMLDKETGKKDADGNEITESIPYLTVYTVFKISQCDGLTQKYHTNDDQLYTFIADASAERVAAEYIQREGITYRKTKGDKAYYRPSTDVVVTPIPEQFSDPAEYYSTLYHELTHSTGHPKRLNRITDSAEFGNEEYSREELVAEIGSASLCATLGVENNNTFLNSAAYIQNWLKALKNDKKMIVVASSRAEKAIRMILNIQED